MRKFILMLLIIVFNTPTMAFCASSKDKLTNAPQSPSFVRAKLKKNGSHKKQEKPVAIEEKRDQGIINKDEPFFQEEGPSEISEKLKNDNFSTPAVNENRIPLDIDLNHFFTVISIPKSGTNLLKLALEELTEKNSFGPYGLLELYINRLNENCKNFDNFVMGHTYSDFYEYMRENLPRDVKIILMIRDHRDILVSYVNWKKELKGILSENVWSKLSVPDRIKFILKEGASGAFQLCSEIPRKIIETFPNVYVCRFEDLVGSKGGGSDDRLYQELVNLAQFINIQVDEFKLQKIAQSIYGNSRSPTFFKGKIGSWKIEFDDEIKDHFKKVLGQTLIDFGYEQDDTW